jgi:glucose/arabinose dehydrogenase
MQTHMLSQARSLVCFFFIGAVLCAGPRSATAQVMLPPGFSDTQIATVTNPTAMQFAPDGRLFVCEQGGTLRVIKDGVLLPTPFVTLSVNSEGERGLLGVALDPNFALNQYVYVYYTATIPALRNRVSRFTANGDVAVPGSEVAIFELPVLAVPANHNGGALNFGADGRLYIAVGDHGVPSNAQSLNTPLGKMLRINSDGTIPADNPFFGVTTGQNRAIWALGLRNPYTFAFDTAGTRMFINDVGQVSWEEINEGVAGANYGWPMLEGYTTDPGFASPTHAYSHADGCAITGGAFYPTATTQFPSSYSGGYFFTDICGFWIRMLDPAAGNAVTTFATGITYPVALAVSPAGDLYYLDWHLGGVHRISYAGGTATADSVTPSSGTGSAQTFALRYSNSTGAGGLTAAFTLISGASGGSCLIYHDPQRNTVGLLNDAGTQYMTGTPGGSGMLSNSRCAITLAGTARMLGGTALTLNLAMSFSPVFAGAKTVYLYAANVVGANSGWHALGTWTVPAPPPPTVTTDSVTPASGTGHSQTFALQASDTAGAENLRTMFFWFTASSTSDAMNSCLAYYDRPSNSLGLLNDATTQYITGTAGTSATLSNSQCAITLSGVTTTASGDSLTLTVPMTFTSAFAGAKNVHLYAASATGANSGWSLRATWTVPASGPAAAVTADSILPASGSGASQTFALRFSDTTGAVNLMTIYALFSGSGGGVCLVFYDRSSNTLGLLNDAGNQYVTGTVGAAGTLANSRCTIALASSSAVVSGTMLTLNLATTFGAPFTGAMNIYLYAANMAGVNSGWQPRGTWTATGSAPPPAGVTADSLTPSSGTGASQTFAAQLSDSSGTMNLSMVFLLFMGGSGDACLVYYDPRSNMIAVLNDAGNGYSSGMAGGAGMVMNSRCTITLMHTSAMVSGNMLTLNVAMSFMPAFAGAKDVYLYGANMSGMNSGWHQRATWMVP